MNFGMELALVLVLILANGVFSMAEIALVASKKSHLKKLADEGRTGAKVALDLAEMPNRFLATVQVGITLVGILAGAFGGDILAARLGEQLKQIPWLAHYSHAISLGIVVAVITFLSLIIGELVPKRVGLNNPERIAALLAKPMAGLSKLAFPIVSLLSASTDGLLKLLGFRARENPPVSEEEIRMLVEQGFHAGVLRNDEKQMVEGALNLDDLTAKDLMTPRAGIVWLNLNDPDELNWRKVVASGYSNFPVYQGNRDQVVGMVSIKSLWANKALADSVELKNLLTEPLVVLPNASGTQLLRTFKENGQTVALITDEYGGIQGLVTLIDVMEAIVGTIPSRETAGRKMTKRDDGSWLCDGMLEIEDLKTRLEMSVLPGEEQEEFKTLAGFALHQFGRIPKEGDSFEYKDFKFEVVDMDRRRIDKMLIVTHEKFGEKSGASCRDWPNQSHYL